MISAAAMYCRSELNGMAATCGELGASRPGYLAATTSIALGGSADDLPACAVANQCGVALQHRPKATMKGRTSAFTEPASLGVAQEGRRCIASLRSPGSHRGVQTD